MNNIEVGNLGEQAAADYLHQSGYEVLTRKYRTKIGEIDIIAKLKDTVVFVEVKTRRSTRCGFPAEAVTYRKQQKIMNTAMYYLSYTDQTQLYCRFDVIEVFLSDRTMIKYNHIIDAFRA
ncbi:YraN family protein [Pelosinus sp. sgz500959]|uniref:YraN family protein n=1 Tax=Pelosinus sp. sgz500959 TaxID=3242472 RepID=UPI0036722391